MQFFSNAMESEDSMAFGISSQLGEFNIAGVDNKIVLQIRFDSAVILASYPLVNFNQF